MASDAQTEKKAGAEPVSELLTAAEFAALEEGHVQVYVGAGQHILCRKPDLAVQMINGVISLPMVTHVIEALASYRDLDVAQVGERALQNKEFLEFITTWACLAAVSPRVVPSGADEPEAVCVESLRYATRLAIFNATFVPGRALAGAGRFPRQRAVAAAGEGGADVGMPALGDAPADGSAAGA